MCGRVCHVWARRTYVHVKINCIKHTTYGSTTGPSQSVENTPLATQLHHANVARRIGVVSSVIRPFCIMILYRYLLHYGLLLHIMSQYLCLFSLILQGLHKEEECRQLEYWAGKGANIRDLFCTTPKVLKLHESCFWK